MMISQDMKLKAYVILQYMRQIAHVTHAQLGRQQKYLEGGAAKTHVSVF